MERHKIRKDRAYSEFKKRKNKKGKEDYKEDYKEEYKEDYKEDYRDPLPIWPIWWEWE